MDKIGIAYLDVKKIEAIYENEKRFVFCLLEGRLDPVKVSGLDRYGCPSPTKDEIAELVIKAKSSIPLEDFLLEELDLTIEEWEISFRTQNILKALIKEGDIKTVKDLIELGERGLLRLEGLGRKTLNELKLIFENKYNIKLNQ